MQVVEVRPFLPVAAIELRHHVGTIHRQGRSAGGRFSRVALQVRLTALVAFRLSHARALVASAARLHVVIIAAHQNPHILILVAQLLADGQQIAGIESHGDRQPGGLMQ